MAYSVTHCYLDPCHSLADLLALPHAHDHPDAPADNPHCHRHDFTRAYPAPTEYSHPHKESHSNAHAHTVCHSDALAYSNAQSQSHGFVHTHADIQRDGYRHLDPHKYTN
jgi:hypothetical protein